MQQENQIRRRKERDVSDSGTDDESSDESNIVTDRFRGVPFKDRDPGDGWLLCGVCLEPQQDRMDTRIQWAGRASQGLSRRGQEMIARAMNEIDRCARNMNEGGKGQGGASCGGGTEEEAAGARDEGEHGRGQHVCFYESPTLRQIKPKGPFTLPPTRGARWGAAEERKFAELQGREDVAREAMLNSEAADPTTAAGWRAREQELRVTLDAHIGGHFELKRWLYLVVGYSKQLELKYVEDNKEGKQATVPLRSQQRILVVSGDDMSAVEHPHAKQASAEDLAKYANSLNGQGRHDNGTMTAYITDATRSTKDSNSVVCETLLNLLEQLEGHHVVLLAMDCGGLNRNGFVALGFAQWLCDSGYTTICIVFFLQLYHSKEMCDRSVTVAGLRSTCICVELGGGEVR